MVDQIKLSNEKSSSINQTFQHFYSVDISSSEPFLHGGELPTLLVQSTGHAVHVFINGQLSGTFACQMPA